MEEVNKIRTEKVSNEELNSETSAAIEGLTRRFATASAKAAQFATDDYEKRPEDYWMKFRDRLRGITADDVQRVAKKYLQPDKIAILVVGDADAILKGNPDKPQFQMTKFGTVERLPLPDPMTMVYPKL